MSEWTNEKTEVFTKRAMQISDELSKEAQACYLRYVSLINGPKEARAAASQRLDQIKQEAIVLNKICESIAKANAMWIIENGIGE